MAIDSKLQEEASEAFTHPAGAVVAMDPNNGDVLALLSRPEYEPKNFVRGVSRDYWQLLKEDSLSPLYDRAIRGLYPPASTFKIFTALAILGEKVAHAGEAVFCNGTYKLGRETKRCWKRGGHGWVNFHTALQRSCDVYYYEMSRRLGVNAIAKYAKKYGLGKATGIGINREVSGLIPTEEWKQRVYKQPWVGGETLSVGIGQGFLQTTPVQLATSVSAVVNGGTIYKPRLALRAQTEKGRITEEYPVEERGKVVTNPDHIQKVIDALESVVSHREGTAHWTARSELVDIAGKTGTAQVVSLRSKKKLEHHAWFVAFAPVKNPKIVVSIIVENAGHGGDVAAPIAKRMIESYLGPSS